MTGALEGVRILDLSRLIAGNMLTMLLADFDADVVKLEQPHVGDTLRGWRVDGRDLYWQVYGRNKRSVTLDLKTDVGREVLIRLASTSHVLVESFRPGTLERLGVGWETLQKVNPALVLVSISGWGLSGSRSRQPGFGTLVEANSGFAAMNGFPDREPLLPPLALADMLAGVYGAFGVVAAVREAERSGNGQQVDLSLFESVFSIMGPTAATFAATGQVPPRSGNRSPVSAPRNIYRTRDGKWIALSATTQAMFVRLAQAIGRGELVTDPRFATNGDRLRNVEALDDLIADFFANLPTSDLLNRMEEAGVTAIAVDDISGLRDSEFFQTRGVVVQGPPSAGEPGGVPMHAPVPRLSGTPATIRRGAPELGEHNSEILYPVTTQAERTLLGIADENPSVARKVSSSLTTTPTTRGEA